jgi:hypothetical protein
VAEDVVTGRRVIPIKVAVAPGAARAEAARMRLEGSGFLRMMTLGEPRLSEFVARYKALGYDVDLLPYADDDTKDASVEDYATLYVRKAKPPPGPG